MSAAGGSHFETRARVGGMAKVTQTRFGTGSGAVKLCRKGKSCSNDPGATCRAITLPLSFLITWIALRLIE
jgi:hypothetical protein